MKTVLRCLVLHLVLLTIGRASLESAQRAQAMVGTDTWSRVVRIENHHGRGRYPATLYATVFEFAGRLWFYTDTDGTQSFSLVKGRLEQDKTDFTPLLRDIDPGFETYEAVMDPNPWIGRNVTSVPNGCFIDSLGALRRAVARGERVINAALLSYYAPPSVATVGHTVLVYETVAGCFLVDGPVDSKPVALTPASLAGDPRRVAKEIAPIDVAQARWLPIPLGVRTVKGQLAGLIPGGR